MRYTIFPVTVQHFARHTSLLNPSYVSHDFGMIESLNDHWVLSSRLHTPDAEYLYNSLDHSFNESQHAIRPILQTREVHGFRGAVQQIASYETAPDVLERPQEGSPSLFQSCQPT
jgi:hypothetical protein